MNIMATFRERTLLGTVKLKRSPTASREERVKHTSLLEKKYEYKGNKVIKNLVTLVIAEL